MEQKNVSYQTFNSFRSALALILPGEIGKDPIVKKFLKGVLTENTKAPGIRKKCWIISRKLVQTLLTRKLMTLQTLSLIRINNISRSEERFQIKISNHLNRITVSGFQTFLDIHTFICQMSLKFVLRQSYWST